MQPVATGLAGTGTHTCMQDRQLCRDPCNVNMPHSASATPASATVDSSDYCWCGLGGCFVTTSPYTRCAIQRVRGAKDAQRRVAALHASPNNNGPQVQMQKKPTVKARRV